MPHITGTIPVVLSIYCCGCKSELSEYKGMIIKNIYNLFYIKKRNFSMQSIAGKELWQKKKRRQDSRLTPLQLQNI